MLRQTTITVTEKVKPSKAMIRKKVNAEKAIALGINLAITALSFALMAAGCITAFVLACNGAGAVENQYFALPAIALAFMWGHRSGYSRCRKKLGWCLNE